MQAVDHHICPLFQGRRGKIFVERKMRPVGFIHDQRDSPAMDDPCDLPHRGDDPVIGGRCDQYRLYIRVGRQGFFHLYRLYGAVQAIGGDDLRIEVKTVQLAQADRVIDRLVAVPGHQ